jgi:hypothetical protein
MRDMNARVRADMAAKAAATDKTRDDGHGKH